MKDEQKAKKQNTPEKRQRQKAKGSKKLSPYPPARRNEKKNGKNILIK